MFFQEAVLSSLQVQIHQIFPLHNHRNPPALRQTLQAHRKICYSGEGSDEFFGGYNMYRNAERYGENLKNFYVGNTNIMKEDEKQKILKKYDPE